MRLLSLYGFYKYYFGYSLTGKKNYALAIRDAEKQIYKAFDTREEAYITGYKDEMYSRQLTIGFLSKFYYLMYEEYQNPMVELDYYRNSIHIPKHRLTGRRKLDIDFGYFYDHGAKKMVLLEYGKLDDVSRWLPVFKTLVTSFELTSTFPSNIKTITFWDLSKGLAYEEDYQSIVNEPLQRVIFVARKIVNERRG
jgi:hypothetical protein